jgi:hypothetical protein
MPPAVLNPPPALGAPLEEWEAYARQRNCYCTLWKKNPGHYADMALTPGFCGRCERCGELGHTRHFPGAVPYTGSWCDRCYRIVGIAHVFRTLAGLTVLALVVLTIAWGVKKIFAG